MSSFWKWFQAEAAPRLAQRAISFNKIFLHLDSFNGPVAVLETGCLRTRGNWEGDGQSTLLFKRYIELRNDGSHLVTIDKDPAAAKICRDVVGQDLDILTGDSVATIEKAISHFDLTRQKLALAYLDSFDVDFNEPMPSALHHLLELAALRPWLDDRTLIVVDDSPSSLLVIPTDNGIRAFRAPRISGKGKLVAEYASRTGGKLAFAHYQAGWTNLGTHKQRSA